LVTYYTVFVIDLASRRVQILGSTPHPNDLFMRHVSRTLTATDALFGYSRVLICDRDRKWNWDVRQLLDEAGVHVVRTPFRAPNANAYAEQFVRSIKHECLDRIVPLGERHFRRALAEFVAHYHRERNHQGIKKPAPAFSDMSGNLAVPPPLRNAGPLTVAALGASTQRSRTRQPFWLLCEHRALVEIRALRAIGWPVKALPTHLASMSIAKGALARGDRAASGRC